MAKKRGDSTLAIAIIGAVATIGAASVGAYATMASKASEQRVISGSIGPIEQQEPKMEHSLLNRDANASDSNAVSKDQQRTEAFPSKVFFEAGSPYPTQFKGLRLGMNKAEISQLSLGEPSWDSEITGSNKITKAEWFFKGQPMNMIVLRAGNLNDLYVINFYFRTEDDFTDAYIDAVRKLGYPDRKDGSDSFWDFKNRQTKDGRVLLRMGETSGSIEGRYQFISDFLN